MSGISRRNFLQFASSGLATIGLSQLIKPQGDRYGKVLAQSTPRKLALLVGINEYPVVGDHCRALRGCINDTEMQRRLLIHRFGFNPSDILVLKNAQATRQGMLDAFEEHLIKQALPGDVVVYHYSGHGSRIFSPDTIKYGGVRKGETAYNGTFVPIDARLPAGYPNEGGKVQDIMGHTLFLLMSALQTENVTAILDSCYSGGATREVDSIPRSRDGGGNLKSSDDEESYQEKWLSRLNLSREEFVKRRSEGVAKGVVLTATKTYQTAADARLNDFFAGAFSYYLTKYLWQQTAPTAKSAIDGITDDVAEIYSQNPTYDVKVGSGYESQPMFFINPEKPTALAVIIEVNGDRATLWFGGLDKTTLRELRTGTKFTIVNGGEGQVILRDRNGLIGEATVTGAVEPGTLLQLPNAVPEDI